MRRDQPELVDEEALAWRNQLTLRLVRSFLFVFLLSAPLTWLALHGALERYVLTTITFLGAVTVGVPAITGRPAGATRSWMVIVPALSASIAGFAMVGFLSGPGVALTITLMLSGLLLGRRVMVSLILISALIVGGIAWAAVTGHIAPPPSADLAMTKAVPWLRSVGVTFLGISLFGSLMVSFIGRIESSLRLAQSETLRREQAERERAEAQIAALQAKQLETMGRLAAGVAHDFNNSLTTIIGSAELLKLELEERTGLVELADAVLHASRHAAELTRQLLAYSRKAQMLLAPTDLHRIVEEAVSFARRSVNPQINIVAELHADSSTVAADPTLLRSAILNLLVNASDAMPEGGKLTVTTSTIRLPNQPPETGTWFVLEVLDTGVGIARELLPHIFDPFFTTKAIGKGTGLGLAAVAGTVKAHGGKIEVDSEVGCGTVFRVKFPCLATGAHVAPPEATGIVHGDGEILLVDDDAMVSLAAIASLESFGYRVTRAADGASALDIVRANRHRFRLILLDLRMPGMSGEATFDALSRLAPETPVLIWSGYAAEQDVHGMLRRGARGFVQKPYRLAELSQAVAAAIGIPRRADEVPGARARSDGTRPSV
ncbi:MAG TPA: ATP-binding protein [Polyangiaceae bacterium]|nr:ATP-binding protein [Polyangiaceae bacterium]